MSVKPESLLAHADFVRYLAYSLIHDEDQAEDVVQQTFLAALEKPPKTRETVKSWLGSVTRNIAYTVIRSDKHRSEREQQGARRGYVPSPEDVLDREADRKRVVEVVLSLEDKYRDPILLRFYENLAPREIAFRLGLPVETVRTQLKRGLGLMRERLDREYGNDRKAWCLALAPIAGIRLGDVAAVTSSSSAPVAAGVLTPGAKVMLGLAAAVIVAVTAIFTWQLLDTVGEVQPHDAFDSVATDNRELPQDELLVNARIDEIPGSEIQRFVREAMESTALVLTGQVTDMRTGIPVPFYDITLEQFDLAQGKLWFNDKKSVHQESVQNDSGRYAFALDRAGYYAIHIQSPNHLPFKRSFLRIPADSGELSMDFQLDPGNSISGRVVDDETGRPLKGVLVGPPANRLSRKLQTKRTLFGEPPWGLHTYTDSDGRFTLHGIGIDLQSIWALHPDFAKGVALNIMPGQVDCEIRLKTGFRIYGKAYPGDVPMIVWIDERPVQTDAMGNYRSYPVSPPFSPNGLRVSVEEKRLPSHSFAHPAPDGTYFHAVLRLEDVDGETELNFGWPDDFTWIGTLLHNGEAVTNSLILVNNETRKGSRAHVQHRARSDGAGCFRIPRLTPGEYIVSIKMSDPERKIRLGMIRFDGGGVMKKDLVLSGSSIAGTMQFPSSRGTDYAGKISLAPIENGSESGSSYHNCTLTKDGRFYMDCLPSGTYDIVTSRFKIQKIESNGVLNFKKGENGRYRFDLPEGQDIQNLRFYTSAVGGFIHIMLSGFEDSAERRILHSFKLDDGKVFKGKTKVWQLSSDGTLEELIPTESLSSKTMGCSMELSVGNLVFRRKFDVQHGRVEEFTIGKNEFVPCTDLISVSGRLEDASRTPVPFARIEFVPPKNLRWKNKAGFRCITDSDGSFDMAGLFEPGEVVVLVTLNGKKWELSTVIPENYLDPCVLTLSLP